MPAVLVYEQPYKNKAAAVLPWKPDNVNTNVENDL